jgi:hypothetical protein
MIDFRTRRGQFSTGFWRGLGYRVSAVTFRVVLAAALLGVGWWFGFHVIEPLLWRLLHRGF